jgi:hypothetical protein
MRSDARSEPLDLERDLPTSAADVVALRRARELGRLATQDYLRFLKALGPVSPDTLRARRGPRGREPFTL